ncbi:hypothetical protein, partial [Klebsiella pneumoniae]|uniref:hypothetical protein n=1 Tax=Klebsiella pneumoniae TaxID=573 RepID=UPI0027312110
ADRVRSCDLPFFRGDRVDELAWGWIRELLSSPEALERGLRKHTTERDRKNAPILARLAVIDDLLTDNRKQLERLLVLFLAAE